MTTPSRKTEDEARDFRAVIPPMLSFVSGYVDTCGFLGFAGLLTSQVTGSFVAAGAAFTQREPGLTAKLLAIPMFMVGACVMTVLVAALIRLGRNPMPAALVLVAVLIALFLALAVIASPFASLDAPGALAAAILAFIAMGAQSALVRVLFKGSVPANFMTGNVTQVAVETTDLLLARFGWLHHGDAVANAARIRAARSQLAVLLPMIICFLIGATISAHAYLAIGFWSLLLATSLVMAAAIWADHIGQVL